MLNPLRIRIHNLFLSLTSKFSRKKPDRPVSLSPYDMDYGRDRRSRQFGIVLPERPVPPSPAPKKRITFPIIQELKDVLMQDIIWLWQKTRAGKQYLQDKRVKQDEYDRALELMKGRRV